MSGEAFTLELPDFAAIFLVGASGSGKSSFARRHFAATEIVSSDECRGLVADDVNDQGATPAAFAVLRTILDQRLALRRLTVIDATNVRREDRASLIALAKERHALCVALVFDLDLDVLLARTEARTDRRIRPDVVVNQHRALRKSIGGLAREGFANVRRFADAAAVDAVAVVRRPLWTDRRDEAGPFDIIGDVHGCFDELQSLLCELGYGVDGTVVTAPAGRKAVFVGDLVDRGPNTPDVLRLVMGMVERGDALCVQGNHDDKLARHLAGRKVTISHGLDRSIAQLATQPKGFVTEVRAFLDNLRSHYWLDGGNLVIAHAGLKEDMQGRGSAAVRRFCLYGETTGETDEFGLPVRSNWAAAYRGAAHVVYGHVPTPEAEWINRTICIDTGCVFGGKLTALRWPERSLVSVPARTVYSEPIRPLAPRTDARAAQAEADALLQIDDVLGKRRIRTELGRHVSIDAGQAASALEALTRWTIDPRWLVYLPPTMSPPDIAAREDLLERPEEAFEYFARHGVAEVVIEEKHMGSRALLIVARDDEVAVRRFGLEEPAAGAVYTRTGRAFFADRALERELLLRARKAAAPLFQALSSDWLLLDAEILPWSVKAGPLLRDQYEPVAQAGLVALGDAMQAFAAAAARGVEDAAAVAAHFSARRERVAAYAEASRPYCWPVQGLDGLLIAPFHLLASEEALHFERPHAWHLEQLHGLTGDPLFAATRHRLVDLSSPSQRDDAAAWWRERTEAGGEGMVVKPATFIARHDGKLIQPALKVRGANYLRLIYGPEYDDPAQLPRLRERFVGRKRALALDEFALGHEALRRFVLREPLRRVHECVAAILALESEPIDPRL